MIAFLSMLRFIAFALLVLAAASPVRAQGVAYTVKPELRNLSDVRPMIDSAAARLLKFTTSSTVLRRSKSFRRAL
jgi:hypothetical protein